MLEYARKQMAGALAMALGEEAWTDRLRRQIDDIFSSFWGLAVATPLMVAAYVLTHRASQKAPMPDLTETDLAGTEPAGAVFADLGLWGYLTAHTASFALAWMAGLFVLVMTARGLNEERRTADIVVGYNWIQCLITLAQSIVLIILLAVDGRIGAALVLTVFLMEGALLFGVIRRGLDRDTPISVGITVMVLLAYLAAHSLIAIVVSALAAGGAAP